MAERNCLLLDSCLDKLYIVLQVWLFLFSFLSFFFPGCSLFQVFFNFGLSGFRPKFVIFSFVIHYARLLPRLVSVLGLERCFQSDSVLYLVFRFYSYWPFVCHPSVTGGDNSNKGCLGSPMNNFMSSRKFRRPSRNFFKYIKSCYFVF